MLAWNLDAMERSVINAQRGYNKHVETMGARRIRSSSLLAKLFGKARCNEMGYEDASSAHTILYERCISWLVNADSALVRKTHFLFRSDNSREISLNCSLLTVSRHIERVKVRVKKEFIVWLIIHCFAGIVAKNRLRLLIHINQRWSFFALHYSLYKTRLAYLPYKARFRCWCRNKTPYQV